MAGSSRDPSVFIKGFLCLMAMASFMRRFNGVILVRKNFNIVWLDVGSRCPEVLENGVSGGGR